jgi:pilus assembly protein CpaB
MDRRFLMVLGVSLVFALVVSSIFYQMTSRATGKKSEVTELKDLVISTGPLTVGRNVKAPDIKVIKVPTAQFPKGAFSKPEDVLDRPVVSNILPEEPILDGRLAQRGSGVGLAPIIPVGMRAVTVRVNDVVGVAGFVLPGMRVDVLITGDPPGTNNRVTRTFLQNILVLSAGQTMQSDAGGKPVNAPNVTLLVSPPQAETLTLAGNEGKIQLVLRNGGDQTIESTGGTNAVDLYGPAAKKLALSAGGGEGQPEEERPVRRRPVIREVESLPVVLPPAPRVSDEIVVIRGTKKETENVAIKKSEGF